MLRFGYFDSDIIGIDDEGMPIFDRAELSDLFALLFASLVSDGVLALPNTCFKIRAAGNGLNIERMPGFGMVKGHFCYDDESDTMTLTAPQAYSRIDRVIMRLNLLERMVEIIVKQGEEAAKPQPPALIRPSAGDYFELCLAEITLTPKQTTITQSSINDTRANSAVCGFITQLIDHLDTAVFFEQLDAFYQEFVDKSNTSYDQFEQMATAAYEKFNADITLYISTLKKDSTDAYNNLISTMNAFYQDLSAQGKTLYDKYSAEIAAYAEQLQEQGQKDVLAIIQQLTEFKTVNEAEFLAWFEHIRGQLEEDPAGKLQLELDQANAQIGDLETMLFTGMVRVNLNTDQGDFITDSLGKPLLIGWPICNCNK